MKKTIIIIALLLAGLTASAKGAKDFKYQGYVVPSYIVAYAKANMQTDSLACEVWNSYIFATRRGATQYAKERFVYLAQLYAGFSLRVDKKGKRNNGKAKSN